MEQRETPYPDPETPFLEVEVLPGPQELRPEARGGGRAGSTRELDGTRSGASGAKVEEAAAATSEAVPREECDGARTTRGEQKLRRRS